MEVLQTLIGTVKEQVLGRDDVIELAVIALAADGHVLLEDFPGSGKTTLAKSLGEAIVDDGTAASKTAAPKTTASEKNSGGDAKNSASGDPKNSDANIVPFRRIQFTPDLLPSDITGVPVFDANSNAFHFRYGPLFAHVVLADEINRTSPKVQSAMLESMGEKQVTVDNKTYPLDDLFFVIATQNPLDLVGTYPLPTPQLDRFLFKITMEHIERDAELDVLETYKTRRQGVAGKATVTRAQVLEARRTLDESVHISQPVKTALVDISRTLRDDDRVIQGNSTRSMVLMLPALQVSAALRGRDYVSADDIELLLPRVLGHRIELAPGTVDINKVLEDCMAPAMESLARATLK